MENSLSINSVNYRLIESLFTSLLFNYGKNSKVASLAKMHQIRFPLALSPDPAGILQCSLRPLAVFKGTTSTERIGEGKKRERGRGWAHEV